MYGIINTERGREIKKSQKKIKKIFKNLLTKSLKCGIINTERERKIPNTRKVKIMTQRDVFTAAKKFNSERHIAYRGDRKVLDIEVVDIVKRKNNKYISHKVRRSHDLADFIDMLHENCDHLRFENVTTIFCFEKFDVYLTYTSDYVPTKG